MARTAAYVRTLSAVSLLAILGCRSDSRTNAQPDEDVPRVVHTSATNPGAHPTTRPTFDAPLDPQGCMQVDCHRDLAQVAYRHEPVQRGVCDTCHEEEQADHTFPLKREGAAGCAFCHPVTGHKEFVHAVIADNGCLPCHDPHGTNTKFLLTRATTELTCQECHKIERKSHLHGPFAGGACTACHQPHESDNAHLLIGGPEKQHCFVCHKDKERLLASAPSIHKPFEEGCTSCHAPHSSDNPHMLVAPIEELCLTCHPDVQGTMAEATSSHDAVFTGQRCANCHDPHAQGRPALLRDDLRSLCLRCHDKPQVASDGRTIPDMRPVLNRKVLHGPVRSGDCSACHQAHGSRFAKLLHESFPTGFYEGFDLENYALCFQCHSAEIVLQPDTDTLTGFRDGDRNLHYVHVNRPEKGRTCRTCHEIHGSNLPRHMASEVQFEGGRWPMPIRFEKTRDGGTCAPGCHEPSAYSRTTRLNPPNPPPAKGPE